MTESEEKKTPNGKDFVRLFKEMIREKKLNILVTFLYLFGLFFFIQRIWDFVVFVIAVFLGMVLFYADKRFLSVYYRESPEDHFYVTRSALFLLSLIPLALYVFTSAGSFWALGIMSGIFVFILVEMSVLRHKPTVFFQHFLQGMKIEVSEKKTSVIFYSFFAFFVLLHFFVIL